MINIDSLKLKILLSIYPIYIRSSLIGGSVLFLFFSIQTISGLLIGISYSWLFDTGLPGVVFVWWETYYGSFLVRIHSEFGNLVFLLLYIHILIKIWNQSCLSEVDQTWMSGIIIFIFTYITGITGAIMPCSILAEVTATVIGYAINSSSFMNFDFLSTPIIPGLGLTDDTMVRVFLIHGLVPTLALILAAEHLNNLHSTEYTDEDEMEVSFFARFEYCDDFIWIELYLWCELIIFFIISRFIVDSLWPSYMCINYSLSNFEFWPLTENIDFALAIPHWYLRPLMGSLVVIPHHYLGFSYIIIYFLSLIFLPFWDDTAILFRPSINSDYLKMRLPNDLDIIGFYFFILFCLALIFTAAIVPTGRYFVSFGGSELLIFSFWYIVCYLFVFIRFGNIIVNEFYKVVI